MLKTAAMSSPMSPIAIEEASVPAPVVPPPPLAHTLHQENSSVLCLAADENYIFSGSQEKDIYVWDRLTLQVKTKLRGHTGSVLALVISSEKKWLFSSADDSTVRIWSTETLTPIFLLLPELDVYSGDIYSLSWNHTLSVLYLGCQDTSIQYYSFDCPVTGVSAVPSLETLPNRYHKFFDSAPRFGHAARLESGGVTTFSVPVPKQKDDGWKILQVPRGNVIPYAHFGYIYCMALVEHEGQSMLLTGSGDEDVKLWECTSRGLTYKNTFIGDSGGVLSLVVREDTVYAGCQSGLIKVWDLETGTLVRTIIAQENEDVLSLSLLGTDLYATSANGQIQRWNASFEPTASWHGHEGIVLSSIIVSSTGSLNSDSGPVPYELVTGANDDNIKLWDIECPPILKSSASSTSVSSSSLDTIQSDTLLHALSQFVSIPSVSSSDSHREDCRQAALFLKRTLTQLGADAGILAGKEGHNPIVFGCFHGAQGKLPRPRLLFYGHYDVIAASTYGWDSDPFVLTGRNGYLYGRGVTDNKGPTLAVAFAVSKLLAKRALYADVILLIEGEEEAGSQGFQEAVSRHKDEIGHVDAILISNSYWIGEDTPCITYGLRGVIHSTLQIFNDHPDLHSGVEGGAIREPMIDMIQLLSTLSFGGKVLIPSFYDKVRRASKAETDSYEVLSKITQKPASSLISRWREPSLSVHSLGGFGPSNSTVIPHSVRAKVSLRIVPDQSLDEIKDTLLAYIKMSFSAMDSPNGLKITIDNTADWWLGQLDDKWFEALESAVAEEWGIRPLRIREGGSIPSVPFLEKEFGCHALHLPMGQSSDQAHLRNERLSLKNLRKGHDVVARFLINLTS